MTLPHQQPQDIMTSFATKTLAFVALATSLQLASADDVGLCGAQKACMRPVVRKCNPDGKREVCITRLQGEEGCPYNYGNVPSDVCSWTTESGSGIVNFDWGLNWGENYCFLIENDQQVRFSFRGDTDCTGNAAIDMLWSNGVDQGSAFCGPAHGDMCGSNQYPESFYQNNAPVLAEKQNWSSENGKYLVDGQERPTLPNPCVWYITARKCPVPRVCTHLNTGIHCPGCYQDMLNGEYVDCDDRDHNTKTDCAPGVPCMTGDGPQELTKTQCEAACTANWRCRFFSSYEDRDCVLHFTTRCDNPEFYPDNTGTLECPFL